MGVSSITERTLSSLRGRGLPAQQSFPSPLPPLCQASNLAQWPEEQSRRRNNHILLATVTTPRMGLGPESFPGLVSIEDEKQTIFPFASPSWNVAGLTLPEASLHVRGKSQPTVVENKAVQ